MTTINHWGKWVDSDTPITGVLSNNNITQFISDSMYDCIDLDFENWLKNHDCENPDDCQCEYWGENDTLLIGDWRKDENGLYEPYDGTNGFACIVSEIYTQVVLSKTTKRCSLCSPCYLGQGDLDSEGDYLAYTLPDDCFDNVICDNCKGTGYINHRGYDEIVCSNCDGTGKIQF